MRVNNGWKSIWCSHIFTEKIIPNNEQTDSTRLLWVGGSLHNLQINKVQQTFHCPSSAINFNSLSQLSVAGKLSKSSLSSPLIFESLGILEMFIVKTVRIYNFPFFLLFNCIQFLFQSCRRSWELKTRICNYCSASELLLNLHQLVWGKKHES